jgi:hypothetical protein
MKDINGNQIKIDFSVIPATSGITQKDSGQAGMTNEEMHILRLLQRGKENAIKEKTLAAATGLQGVEARATIRHLIMEHGVLIASCGAGFFIAETEEEIKAATRSLRHRGIMILMRAAKLQKISLEDIFHQSRIEFKEGEAA